MIIKGVIFDKDGTTYTINNIAIYVGEMKDELLVKTYSSTIFFHNLTLVMEKLVKKGLAKESNLGEVYIPELTENAINVMKDEIIERFDEDYHDYVINKIELSIFNKIPKNL